MNNVDIIDGKAETLLKSTEENKTIKELNIVNQKEQLDAATEAAIVTNSALDGAAVDNHEIIKKSTANLENTGIEMSNETYADIVKNDVAYSKIRTGLEKTAIDDLDERLAEEKKVRDASVVQSDLENKNRERSDAKTVETKEVLTKVENNIAVKTTDDKVLSLNNDNKIKEIEKVQSDFKLENDKEHVENTQRFAAKTSEMEKVTTEAISSRVEAHRENIDVIETARDKEIELQRADYNKAYVKNIENKQVLTLKEKEAEKRNDLPSISQTENNRNFTQIQDASTQTQLDQKKINDEKIVANKSKITSSQNQIEDQAGQNTQSTDNAAIIKNSNKELGTTAKIQSEKGDERAQSTKKSID